MIVHKGLIRAFGQNVKGRRQRRKWLQVNLAERADLKTATISRIERGETNARLSTVEAIARAFQIDPADLLSRLSARRKTLDREEAVFDGNGWEDVDHGSDLVQAFGANVRFHRTRLELSQAKLARRARLRSVTISEIELAKSAARVSTVESIAQALQIDSTFLVRRPENDDEAAAARVRRGDVEFCEGTS